MSNAINIKNDSFHNSKIGGKAEWGRITPFLPQSQKHREKKSEQHPKRNRM